MGRSFSGSADSGNCRQDQREGLSTRVQNQWAHKWVQETWTVTAVLGEIKITTGQKNRGLLSNTWNEGQKCMKLTGLTTCYSVIKLMTGHKLN